MAANEVVSAPWDEMIVVGRVARAHGRRGEVIVNLETDFPEIRFRQGNLVYAQIDGQTRGFRIAAVRFQSGRPVLALAGIETMTQAEALALLEFRVPETELMPLPADTYYQHQLTGCGVTTVGGALVGTVMEVRGGAGAHRLVVRTPSGSDEEEIEVPLAEPICVRVDLEHRMIVVDPPDGLLELNQRR